LKKATVASTSLAIPMVASSRVLGANDEIIMAIVGLGGRGAGAHLPSFQRERKTRVVAVCDPDMQRIAGACRRLEKLAGATPRQYQDIRKMLDEGDDIDAIGNATQNYWHGLSTIWACEAGKHVYCEKPWSHYIWEGRQMVNAARKNDVLAQCGTQHRSRQASIDAIKWLHEGHLGKIKYVVAVANKPRKSCGKREEPMKIPGYIDYDLWCGPARKEPIYRDRLQYDCSFCWNTGGGESINQGVHEMDLARWMIQSEDLPRRVMSIGGRFVFNDACDCPNTQICYYDFPEAPVIYEVHNLRAAKGSNAVPNYLGHRVATVAHCEGGELAVAYQYASAKDKDGKEIKRWGGGDRHFHNFVEAVRAGDRDRLTAEAEVGQRSTRVPHTGNISYRLGKPAPVEEARKQIADAPYFDTFYDRFLDHLSKHEIDPATATLGPWLECDTPGECFKGPRAAEANEIVRGWYREPYTVPEIKLG
jgi:predicted dehydrogenase